MLGRNSQESPGRQPEDVVGENINHALREIDELGERWHNSLSIKNLALAERYLKGELEFGVVFVAVSGDSLVGAEFVAVFERKFPIGGRPSKHGGRGQVLKAGSSDVPPYSEHLLRCGYRDEQLMFVGDVETVYTAEGLAPSTVRLQSADQFERIRTGTLEVAGQCTRSKMSDVRTYWERCILVGRSTVVDDQGVGEIIERRAQIVGTVADDGAPLIGNGDIQPKAVDFVTGTRFFIEHDAVRMERVVSLDGRFEVRKVFFGPVNLYASATQGFRHGEVRSNERP
jgi:hypothetical protein